MKRDDKLYDCCHSNTSNSWFKGREMISHLPFFFPFLPLKYEFLMLEHIWIYESISTNYNLFLLCFTFRTMLYPATIYFLKLSRVTWILH